MMVTANSSSANIPAEIRAFMVLKRACVSDTQRMLILSKMNLEDKPKMFDAMSKKLKLILGGGPGITSVKNDSNIEAVRVENVKNEEGVFITF